MSHSTVFVCSEKIESASVLSADTVNTAGPLQNN